MLVKGFLVLVNNQFNKCSGVTGGQQNTIYYSSLLSKFLYSKGVFCAQIWLFDVLLPSLQERREKSKSSYKLKISGSELLFIVPGITAGRLYALTASWYMRSTFSFIFLNRA